MSQFHGQQDFTGRLSDGSFRRNKGVMARRREQKRAEAEERNDRTLHENTKAHRLGRCDQSTSDCYQMSRVIPQQRVDESFKKLRHDISSR